MKKEKKNYLDYIPKTNKTWGINKNGVVELMVENKGFFNMIAQKVFKKPRFSFIVLDEYGSFVWKNIDGEKSIYEIGQELKDEHEGAGQQLYERLAKFVGILESNEYITFINKG